jgi:predicted regulator of Ras-like GTPase activity (Roadblock/LC7/MglB family)
VANPYTPILDRMNHGVGVRGSMVVTGDGVVVATALGHDLEEERVAAMASSVIRSTQSALQALEGSFDRFILTAVHGRMVFFDVGPAFVVVLTEKNINLEATLLEIDAAARKIRALGEINIED